MGRAIFISYRRDDTEGEAGRLFDDLVRSFPEGSVFMDVAGINPGMDFRKAIDDNVASCGVLLAMIGPAWCSIKNADGVRRLDDPNDFVRLEIASALARDVAVIPVLVHDAKMPHPEDLPENLKDLAFRNSVEITHARWNSDVQLLTAALGRYVAPTAATDTTPVHATVAVQLPPPTASGQKELSSPSNIPLKLGIGAAVVLALGIVAFFLFRPNPVSALLGTWTNPTPVEQNGLEKLEVSAGGSQALTMHAWGKCGQLQCDWGSQPATVTGQQAQATWQLGTAASGSDAKRTAAILIKPDNGQLAVTVSNTYPDRPANQHEFTFAKAQP
jgi:TIR domain